MVLYMHSNLSSPDHQKQIKELKAELAAANDEVEKLKEISDGYLTEATNERRKGLETASNYANLRTALADALEFTGYTVHKFSCKVHRRGNCDCGLSALTERLKKAKGV